MSVESCTPAAPKTAAQGARGAHGAHGARGKASVAGDAGAPGAGDFSALLMQLGAGDEDVAADDLVSATEGAAPDVVAGQDLLAKEGAAVDPNLLLAQSLQFQKNQPPVDARPTVRAPDGDAVMTAAVSGDVVMTAAVSGEALSQQARPETQGGAPAPAPKSQDLMRPELGEAIKDVAAKTPTVNRNTSRAAVKDVTPVQAGATANANATANVSNQVAAEARLQKLAQGESRLEEPNSGVAQAVVAVGASELGVRRAERVGERTETGQGGKGDGTWSQALPAMPATEPTFTMAEPAAVMSPEAMVAEQVNYWIGQDVQNAELKFDGMGNSPVEVSISLQGNEARVEFRTDHLEARQVLEGAVSHLKDLLGNEGLVLSGVSVGSSGADGSSSQERRPGQGGRQATVAVSQPQPVEAGARPARVSGRSVDLFV